MIRFIISFASFLLVSCVLFAGNSKYNTKEALEYIQRFHKVAISNMYVYNIPASITLAQGILESGSGRSDLALKANNHFGIKCKDDYEGKTYYKLDDSKSKDCFRCYANAAESYADHSKFLTQRPNYTSLFTIPVTDYKAWAKGLKACGYATNPEYASLLINIIEDNKLYVYDRNPEKYLSRSDVTKEVEYPANHPPVAVNGKINSTKCVYVKKGETLWGLSKKYGMTPQMLREFNDFSSSYVLRVGEVVYLQQKQRRYYQSKYHYVEKGEDMLSISQLYGMQLSVLKEMNHLKTNKVEVGTRLVLHY